MGPRSRRSDRGFMLIELIIVMIIISVLVAIAVPTYHDMRERGYVGVMRSDLRNLSVMQESYFIDQGYYTDALLDLQRKGFQVSAGVDLAVREATVTGWSASTSHPGTSQECHIFVGFAAPVGSANVAGVIDCG